MVFFFSLIVRISFELLFIARLWGGCAGRPSVFVPCCLGGLCPSTRDCAARLARERLHPLPPGGGLPLGAVCDWSWRTRSPPPSTHNTGPRFGIRKKIYMQYMAFRLVPGNLDRVLLQLEVLNILRCSRWRRINLF